LNKNTKHKKQQTKLKRGKDTNRVSRTNKRKDGH